MSAQVTALKETLPALVEGTAPLNDLRDEIANQHLAEYQPTGETPQRVPYAIPSQLPRTEKHETLLARLRGQPLPSQTPRSPTKRLIFTDATESITKSDDLSPTDTKPDLTRSNSAPGTGPVGPSLRELDVNIVSQQESHTLPLVLPSDALGAAEANILSLKKQNRADADSKLPMKKMSRKTVGGVAASRGPDDRENLTITNFSSSIGPGLAGAGGRKLRSHGSQ
jgi:kinesin family protein 11